MDRSVLKNCVMLDGVKHSIDEVLAVTCGYAVVELSVKVLEN